MRSLKLALVTVAFASLVGFAAPAPAVAAPEICPGGRSPQAAMWYSIARPGLGEYYLNGWGRWSHMPQRKFWLGFIPVYGWPGYLQVKSAIDARNCRTNDDLTFRE